MEEGEQAFVVLIKHLLTLMKTNSHAFLDGYVFYSIKLNIKDSITGCVSITSEKFTLNE